jgi:hypothetical protein
MTCDTMTVKRAKRMARTLQDVLKEGRPKGYSGCLETVARLLGYDSFNALQADLPPTDADRPADNDRSADVSRHADPDRKADARARGLVPDPREIPEPEAPALEQPSYATLHATVQKIALMTGDGEELGDGVYYEMSIDDAFENLAEAIELCRTTLGGAPRGNTCPEDTSPCYAPARAVEVTATDQARVILPDAAAPGIAAAVAQAFDTFADPAAVEVTPVGVDVWFGQPPAAQITEVFDHDELVGDARRFERDFDTLAARIGTELRSAIGVRDPEGPSFRIYLLDDRRAPTQVWAIVDPARERLEPAALWSDLETRVAPLADLDLQHLKTI